MTENKHHWYDGWVYDKIIAPNQDRLFGQINELVESGSNVIDVGCGTGRLAFTIKGKCDSILGIDLSRQNIERANMTLSNRPDDRVSFLHTNISEINKMNKHFDYAILTYVIHEVDEGERIKLLNDIAGVADKIIIGDYLFPKPSGFGSFISEVIEFIAGTDHYRNFKSYMANGGINYLAGKAGLKIVAEQCYPAFNNHIVTISK